MVVCADDCAVMSGNKAVGRRGLAGSLFLMKVFSFFFLNLITNSFAWMNNQLFWCEGCRSNGRKGWTARNHSWKTRRNEALHRNYGSQFDVVLRPRYPTFSCGLLPPSFPFQQKRNQIIISGAAMFHLPDDEVELGLGIHGEAGVKRIKVTDINCIILPTSSPSGAK